MTRPRLLFVVVAVVLGAAVLFLAGFVGPFQEGVRAMMLPFARVSANMGAGVGRFLGREPGAAEANERAEELEARLRTVTVDYVRLRALEEENRSLRAQANFIVERGFQTVGARVVSRSLQHGNAVVTIDRGARDGVQVGQAVVTDDGLLVGKVQALGERTSVVLLVTDVRSRVAAAAAGTSRLDGIVEGQGSGTARFTLVPQSVPLERDDILVTSGTEEQVPPNIVIGLVNDVASQPTDPFKSAAIEPLAPLDRLELVSVVVPGP